MTNGARHVIGIGIGLIAFPVIVYSVAIFGPRVWLSMRVFELTAESAVGIVMVVAIGAALGVLTTSRVSPLAALIPGLGVGAFGVIGSIPSSFSAMLHPFGDHLPSPWMAGTLHLLIIGGVLTVSAVFPSRWRAAPEVAHRPPWQGGPGMHSGAGHMHATPGPGGFPSYGPGSSAPPPGPGVRPSGYGPGPQAPPFTPGARPPQPGSGSQPAPPDTERPQASD